jgi:uncharacterized RDD family membrane protein YckC
MNNKQDDNIDIDNLELANTRSRILAFTIDYTLINILVIILIWDKILLTDGTTESIALLLADFIVPVLLIEFLYQTFFIWYYGATLGKIALKIRVINHDDFTKVDLMTAVNRAIFRIIDKHLIMMLGFLMFFFTDSRQTLHDKFAKTLVVNG